VRVGLNAVYLLFTLCGLGTILIQPDALAWLRSWLDMGCAWSFLPHLCTQMYVAMHKMSRYESFTQKGGNVDQAFRKVWDSFMLLLDDQLKRETNVNEGLLLTNGDNATRSVFSGLLTSRLVRTMELLSKAARLSPTPPSAATAAAAATLATASNAMNNRTIEDDGDDDDDNDDDDDGAEGEEE